MNLKLLFPGCLFLSAAFLPFKAMPSPSAFPLATQQKSANLGAEQKATVKASVHEEEGQRIFDQNCSRCHTAPDGFSQRISGTVIRHMRVRASLSRHDEKELLRFLNP